LIQYIDFYCYRERSARTHKIDDVFVQKDIKVVLCIDVAMYFISEIELNNGYYIKYLLH